jgi:RNA-splicing ligase RtcB
MFEIYGKYTDARIMIDQIDAETEKQIIQFINDPNFTKPVAIMPDCHAGKGAVVGFTMPLCSTIIPNVIGVDIGCGMLTSYVGDYLPVNVEDCDALIRSLIPFGTNVNSREVALPSWWFKDVNEKLKKVAQTFRCEYKTFGEAEFSKLCERADMDKSRALKSLGTLGGGNHFIELGIGWNDFTKKDDFWLTFHSGSRQLGKKIADYHQKLAGKGDLAWLEGQKMYNYLFDMVVCQMYAALNRRTMAQAVFSEIDGKAHMSIESIHNFIDFDDFVIRKGAIRSYKGEKMIIPFNMEDGLLICEGKSNPKWNFSAPHGAGRLGSRKWAKANLSADEARTRMEQKGIYTSCVPTDEVKGAYKDPAVIESAIEPTAVIVGRIKPILNCKEEDKKGTKR